MENAMIFFLGILAGFTVSVIICRLLNTGSKKYHEEMVQLSKFEKVVLQQVKRDLGQIIEMAGEEDEIDSDGVASRIGVAKTVAIKYLKELENRGRLEEVGSTGKYTLFAEPVF